MMIFRRNARIPIDLVVPCPKGENGEATLMMAKEYIRKLTTNFQNTFKVMRRNLGNGQEITDDAV